MKTLFKRLAFWLPLLLVWALPAGIIVFAFQNAQAQEEDSLSMPLPTTVDVGSRERAFAQPVMLTLKFDKEPSPVIGASGTVTKINYEHDKKISEGAALITVDQITLRAHRGEIPFHRDLARGDQGKDVTELARFLTVALKEDVAPDANGKFGYRMTEAVKKYQRANGASASGIFEKAYVIFLPDDVTRFGDSTVRVGEQVNAGDEFTKPAETVRSAQISAHDGGLKSAAAPGPYELVIQDVAFTLESLTLDPDIAADIYSELTEAGIEPAPGEDPAERSYGSARLAVQNPVEVATVTPSAVYASPSGQFCIFEAHQDGEVLTGKAIVLDEVSGFEGEISVSAIDIAHVGKTVIRAPQTLSDAVLAECS